MNYAQVFDSYDALRAYLEGGLNQRDQPAEFAKSLSYADFGKAVFGHYLFTAASGLGSMDPASPDYPAALAAAMPSASLVVWQKFGRELTEIPTVFGTLAELNAVALVDPSFVTYRKGGLPAAIDYSGAGSGVSRTYTVSMDGFKGADRKLTAAALTQYRSLDWRFLVGAVDSSLIPRIVVPATGAGR